MKSNAFVFVLSKKNGDLAIIWRGDRGVYFQDNSRLIYFYSDDDEFSESDWKDLTPIGVL